MGVINIIRTGVTGELKSSRFEVRADRHSSNEILSLDPKEGVFVFDNQTKQMKFYNGASWRPIGEAALLLGQKVLNYSLLEDGENAGDIAYCKNSQGTAWLPSTLGGSYYLKGFYIWDGTTWKSDRNAIANQLATTVSDISTLQLQQITQNSVISTKVEKEDFSSLRSLGFMVHSADTLIKQQTQFIKSINNNWI